MTLPFIYHGQSEFWVRCDEKQLTLTLVTAACDVYDRVLIRHEPDNEEYLVAMSAVGQQGQCQYWQASIALNTDCDTTHYAFKLLRGRQQFWLTGQGISRHIPARLLHFKYNAHHQPPSWVSEQVFYQIFPDRFANGRPEISVQTGEYSLLGGKTALAKTWGEPVGDHQSTGACEFYGGDLYGVEQKLDYLAQLGISALYLNPIFSAPSNHKYDTTDYLNVDAHLGGNSQFASLCQALHQRGMRITLDAVFNHTSTAHPWFDRDGQHPEIGAYQSPDSTYRDYYFFEDDSNRYIGWKGIDALPVLNFKHPAVRDAIYAGDDAIIKHWLKPPYAIDGWRFDVIHMLGEGQGAKNNAYYVKAFRDSAKQVNPDCYILGEHFFEAAQWLQGDQEDGSMNYFGFAHPLRALLANLDISGDPIEIEIDEFCRWLDQARAALPWANQLAQLNQLDSHDTPRFFTMVGHDVSRFYLASALLFTYVGTPCLYYGTELALAGGADPDNRRCMPWQHVAENPHLEHFKTLIALRHAHPALQKGDFQWLVQAAHGLVFARVCRRSNDVVIFAMNLAATPVTYHAPLWQTDTVHQHFQRVNHVGHDCACDGELALTVPANSFEIWVASRSANQD